MLSKLLKYDLKSKIPFLCIFYALAIGCAGLSRLFGLFSQVPILNIIGQIFSGAAISMIFNILINNILRSWALFRQNLYGDPSYLTHTLPVGKPTLYLSKALDGLITMCISFGVSCLTLLLLYCGTNLWDAVKMFLQMLPGGKPLLTVALLIGLVFLEVLNMLQCGFAGLILGHKMNKGKIRYSVLTGLGIYVAGSVFVFATFGVIALFNPEMRQFFVNSQSNIFMMENLRLILAVGCVAYAAFIAMLYVLNVKWLTQGVNVD